MGTLADARINTTQGMVLYRGCIIEEAYVPGRGNCWGWVHEDYGNKERAGYGVLGDCETLFECIDAIEDWHASRSEDALRTIREGEKL